MNKAQKIKENCESSLQEEDRRGRSEAGGFGSQGGL